MESTIHIFIIWEKARAKTDQLLGDIRRRFIIKDVYEIGWSHEKFAENLRRFYGATLPKPLRKVETCGSGKFLVVIIEDPSPKNGWRKTSIGKQLVNTNIYDQKMVYRRLVGGEYPIHASINQTETDHDLALIFGKNIHDFRHSLPEKWNGKTKSLMSDLRGANGWKDLKELFYVLNSTTNYLVLRNFEGFPEKFGDNKHKDIDLLTDDRWQIPYILNKQIFNESNGNARSYVLVNNEKVSFDLRYIGDGYYDEKWSQDMLKRKILAEGGFYRPSDQDYFYSLLYHVLIHKSKVSPDYLPLLDDLAGQLNIKNFSLSLFDDRKKIMQFLNNFLKQSGYRYTDSLLYKTQHNEFTRLGRVSVQALKKEGTGYLLRAIKGKLKRKIFG